MAKLPALTRVYCGEAPTRNDIDALAFLPARIIPLKGANYYDTHDWEFSVAQRQKVRMLMKEMMKSRRTD